MEGGETQESGMYTVLCVHNDLHTRMKRLMVIHLIVPTAPCSYKYWYS